MSWPKRGESCVREKKASREGESYLIVCDLLVLDRRYSSRPVYGLWPSLDTLITELLYNRR